jgi:hypothetical protein
VKLAVIPEKTELLVPEQTAAPLDNREAMLVIIWLVSAMSTVEPV